MSRVLPVYIPQAKASGFDGKSVKLFVGWVELAKPNRAKLPSVGAYCKRAVSQNAPKNKNLYNLLDKFILNNI